MQITSPLTNKNIENKKTDAIICEAYACLRTATTTIVLKAGTKKIELYICGNCKSKFE